jgi:phenylacetate-coenzyme A ligase PaaK-like adenylate-forming protein
MQLEAKIFSIQNVEEFSSCALEVFQFQFQHCSIYREFVQNIGKKSPKSIEEIPFLPISFFKSHDVKNDLFETFETTFLSSGTTGMTRSKHLVPDLTIYEKAFTLIYKNQIGDPKDQVILALLPNYIEQGNSSLVYMVKELIEQTQNNLSDFLLDKSEEIETQYNLALAQNKKVVIIGVSYALLDLAEKNIDLHQAIIIETGGMKGRRKELNKEELHAILKQGLKVPQIYSEYGMTELLSQAYSTGNELFTTPPWMKVLFRDINDPFNYVAEGKTGGINVIDLANINSCSFIATQDLGRMEGKYFKIMGRFDNSDLRGCNLLVE